MDGMQWVLDLALIGLLAATLFHALRLERALGVLKRDRAALEELIDGFNASTRQAELGIGRLRDVAEGAGRQIVRHIETASTLKDDLGLLMERGERLADRMDALVRAGRTLTAEPPRLVLSEPDLAETPRVRSQAERDLLKALRPAR
jgi:chromosome segregation ATPase